MSLVPTPNPSLSTKGGDGITLRPLFPSRGRKYSVRVEDIMVRDIRYVTLNCKYRDLQQVLHSTKMKNLPLVESAGETQAGALPASTAAVECATMGGGWQREHQEPMWPLAVSGRVHDPTGLH